MTRRTIILVTPYYPPAGGGLERYASEVARYLDKEYQWRVVVITSGVRGGRDERIEKDGLTIYRLAYHLKLSNTPLSLSWFGKIRRILRTENPDIVNIHTPVPGIGDIAALLTHAKPLIVTYHTGSMEKSKLLPDLLIRFYELVPMRILLRRADRIVCSSDFVRLQFLRRYQYKSVTITPAADSDKFVPDASRRSAQPTIAFVAALGTAEQHKGLWVLLDAVRRLCTTVPDVRLVVAGDGDMRPEYEAEARRMGIADRVQFRGRLAGDALVALYQEAQVFALPTRNDSSPTVIIEAMACGLPVVSTRVGGIPSLVTQGESGFLVEPGDVVGLTERLSRLLHDRSLAEKLGRSGRDRVVKDFSWQQRVVGYHHVLMQALGSRADHTPRIVVVAPYFFPKVGGLENYAYHIARGLQQSGSYRVSIVTSNYETKGYTQDVVDGMTVHRLPVWFKISNTPVNPMWFFWLRRIFNAEQPDVVHLHSPVPFMADVAARAASRKPIVLTYHAGSMLKSRFPVDVLIYIYERTFLRGLFRRADVIVPISGVFARNRLVPYLYKLHSILPGVDLKRFMPTYAPENQKVVSFVGRIETSSAWKGIGTLLQAMVIVAQKHPEVRLEFIGGGNAIEEYRAQARRLGIAQHVVFFGPLSGDELVLAYRRSTVVALPSTSDSESFGTVLVEAMASGRPVIGSNIGGIPQVIDHGTSGLLVEPGDVEALAGAIDRILSDPAMAKRLANAGTEKVRSQFDWNLQVRKYDDLFQSVLTDRGLIVHVAAYYPPHIGGMERVVQAVVNELEQKGRRVLVLTSDIGRKNAQLEHQDAGVRTLKSFEWAHTPFAPMLLFRLLELPKRSIIHLHVAQAYYPEMVFLASRLRNIPYIAHFHLDVGPSGPLGFLFVLYKKVLLGTVLRAAAKVIVFSEDQASLVHEKYRVDKRRIAVIANGVGREFFLDASERASNQPLRLLYVGRFSVQKRVERLLEAMRLLNIPAHLTLVGDGEDRRELEEMVRQWKLSNVTFAGPHYGTHLLNFYRDTDVFLIASDNEGMPLVVLEAMAAGLPVIGSDVIGIKELVGGTGVLVENPSGAAFADAIAALYHNPAERMRLARLSGIKANEHSWTHLVERLEVLYQSVS